MVGEKTRRLMHPETGEVVDWLESDEDARAGGRRRVKLSSDYTMLFELALRRIARDRRITGTHMRVLFAVMTTIPVNGDPAPTNAKRIGEITELSPKTVYTTLTGLVALGLLLRPTYGYLALNPRYFWRGPAERREQELRGLIEFELTESQKNREAAPQEEDS